MTDKPSFPDAVDTRDAIKPILTALGLRARYKLVVGDDGPRVVVFVAPEAFQAVQDALLTPPGRASVQVLAEDPHDRDSP